MSLVMHRRKPTALPAEDNTTIHRGSGNFLADRGISDPEEFKVKGHLCHEIASIIETRKLTQQRAAEVLGLAQADVSRIVNNRFDDYSVWRLMKALSALGVDIIIGLHTEGEGPGTILSHSLGQEVVNEMSLGAP